jgi:hypothetical protein
MGRKLMPKHSISFRILIFCFYSKENYTGPALSKMGVPHVLFKGKSPFFLHSKTTAR